MHLTPKINHSVIRFNTLNVLQNCVRHILSFLLFLAKKCGKKKKEDTTAKLVPLNPTGGYYVKLNISVITFGCVMKNYWDRNYDDLRCFK